MNKLVTAVDNKPITPTEVEAEHFDKDNGPLVAIFGRWYNAGRLTIIAPACICTADLTDWPVTPNIDCPVHGSL